jgi:uncharacterized protein YndB with AHSA1/START domain
MIEFTIETEIERPVSEVFAYVTDPAKLPSWQTNTVSATVEGGGRLALGSRLREVHRGPGGKELKSLVEVSELEPDQLFALTMVDGSLPIHAHIAFEPAGGGTQMLFTVHGQPRGPLRFLQPLLQAALKRQFRQHCANLKQVLEGPTATLRG